jgi:rubrerythrin
LKGAREAGESLARGARVWWARNKGLSGGGGKEEIPCESRRLAVGEKREELLKILNQALGAEYGTLWLLPQHMAQVADEELKRELKLIAEVELEHAEKSAQMIYRLGGVPNADLPNMRPRSGVEEILRAHVAGEKAAIALYERAVELAEDAETRKLLEEMKREEEGHQRLLERSLARR